MFKTQKELILASQSPRRRQFLEALGVKFTVVAASVDESRKAAESPELFVERMAKEKAMSVAIHKPGSWVLSADTIVFVGECVFGKPASREDGVEMLMHLSGKEHRVVTGYCVCRLKEDIHVVEHVVTRVKFVDFPEAIARAYMKSGEPLDKAGGYGIQGTGGALVAEIHGSYSNVVGLPLAETTALLQKYRVIIPG